MGILDIILGLYYLSIEREGELGEGRSFTDLYEIEKALYNKDISLHAKITTRVVSKSLNKKIRVNTTQEE